MVPFPLFRGSHRNPSGASPKFTVATGANCLTLAGRHRQPVERLLSGLGRPIENHTYPRLSSTRHACDPDHRSAALA